MTGASKPRKKDAAADGLVEASIPCDVCKNRTAAKLRFVPAPAGERATEPAMGDTVGRLEWKGPFSEGSSPVCAYELRALLRALRRRSGRDLYAISTRYGRAYCPHCDRTLCGRHAEVHHYDGDVEALCRCGNPRPVGGDSVALEELYYHLLVKEGTDPLPIRKRGILRERRALARARARAAVKSIKEPPKGKKRA